MTTKHRRRDERDGFTCCHCRAFVPAIGFGTKHRNHCPRCLWSRHVDERPGDRLNPCRAPMEPIAVAVRSNEGEWSLIHRCTSCGELIVNRIGGDDSEIVLLMLALRPLARPAFPLDGLEGQMVFGA